MDLNEREKNSNSIDRGGGGVINTYIIQNDNIFNNKNNINNIINNKNINNINNNTIENKDININKNYNMIDVEKNGIKYDCSIIILN